MPSKKNETFAYLGGRGSKKNSIILHLINGTFIMGGRGSEFFVSCLILKKTTQKGDVEGFQTGFVWKNPLRFYPAGLIRINPPAKSQKNPPEGGFF